MNYNIVLSKTLQIYLCECNSGKRFRLRKYYSLILLTIGLIGWLPMVIDNVLYNNSVLNQVLGIVIYLTFNILINLLAYCGLKHKNYEQIYKYFEIP